MTPVPPEPGVPPVSPLPALPPVPPIVAACSSKESPSPSTDLVLPDLVGKYWYDAEPQLRNLGWTGFLNKGPNILKGPEDRNRIITQRPPSGERIQPDDEITLQFGL